MMNLMVDHTVGQCIEFIVSSTKVREGSVKLSVVPSKQWETVSIDFVGTYPDGHFNLVVIDKRMRYLEFEPAFATGSRTAKKQILFANHGIPERLESKNGLLFNSRDFKEFAENYGFISQCVAHLLPRTNGETERFKLLGKRVQVAHLKSKNKLERIWPYNNRII